MGATEKAVRIDEGELRPLPSGRSVTLRASPEGEQLTVRSPAGEVEVVITFDEAGPVVRLSGARLELAAAKGVSVECGHFEVKAGEVDLQGEGEVRVRGGLIRLN